MNPDLGTELRSGRIISSSLETPVQTDPDMAQSSANDSDSNETSDISSQLSEIKESYERKINELQNEFSQLKDLMMAVISKTDTENRQSTSKGPSKPTHTVGLDRGGTMIEFLFPRHCWTLSITLILSLMEWSWQKCKLEEKNRKNNAPGSYNFATLNYWFKLIIAWQLGCI